MTRPDPAPEPRSFTDAIPAFAAGRDTSTAFIDRCLATYEAVDGEVRAYVAVAREAAAAAASKLSAAMIERLRAR